MHEEDLNEEARAGRSRRKRMPSVERSASFDRSEERNGYRSAYGDAGGEREKVWKVKKKKRKSARWIRLRRLLILSVMEVFVLAGIFAYAYVLKQYNKIQRPDFQAKNVENTHLTSEDIQKMKGYWNIAVFGVDSRNSSVGRGYNADVIMIASINRENGDIRLASVFRDSYLSLGDGTYSKINQAYAVGGPEQAVRALNQNLDLNITDYVTFNWKAVATGVNILGGVEMDITKPEFRYLNSYITETVKGTGIGSVQLKAPGKHHLDGVQAVAYARLRYMDNDYTRTERQRKVIQLCVEKAKRADAQTLSDLAGNLLTMVATSLRWEDGMSLALNVQKYKIAGTLGFPMERAEVSMGKRGACVLPQTLESNVKALHEFLFGDTAYEVSKQVKEIDYKLAVDRTKYKNQAEEAKREKLEEENAERETGKEESSDLTDSVSGKKSESAAPEEGGFYRETDAYGRPIFPTDARGEMIVETDEYGNPLFDLHESDSDDEGEATFETDPFGRPTGLSPQKPERPSYSENNLTPETKTSESAPPFQDVKPLAPGEKTDEMTERGPGSVKHTTAQSAPSAPTPPKTEAAPGPGAPGIVMPHREME